MIWQNPWAWVGLLSLALPVAIHLLSRGHARVLRFPTLRFVAPSLLLPTRRTRIHELLLLATRLGILAAAVAALAQPLIVSAARSRTLAGRLARVIIVDTSASMNRRTPQGVSAAVAARTEARGLAAEAQTSIAWPTVSPSRAIGGAVAWLARQPGRRELVIVSDMQLGTISVADLAVVPSSVGVRLVRTPVTATSSDSMIETRTGRRGGVVVARTSSTGETVWRDAPGVGDTAGVLVLAGPAERDNVDAATRAARAAGVRLPRDSTRAIAIAVTPVDRRESLSAPRAPWMMDAVAQLRGDSGLLAAAARARPATTGDTLQGVIVARGVDGTPLIVAGEGIVAGRDRLVLVSRAGAGTLATAVLIAAADRVRSIALPLEELEPGVLPDETIAKWQRAPATEMAPGGEPTGISDGRWFWILALALLALEYWLRGARPGAVIARPHTARDRAA